MQVVDVVAVDFLYTLCVNKYCFSMFYKEFERHYPYLRISTCFVPERGIFTGSPSCSTIKWLKLELLSENDTLSSEATTTVHAVCPRLRHILHATCLPCCQMKLNYVT